MTDTPVTVTYCVGNWGSIKPKKSGWINQECIDKNNMLTIQPGQTWSHDFGGKILYWLVWEGTPQTSIDPRAPNFGHKLQFGPDKEANGVPKLTEYPNITNNANIPVSVTVRDKNINGADSQTWPSLDPVSKLEFMLIILILLMLNVKACPLKFLT